MTEVTILTKLTLRLHFPHTPLSCGFGHTNYFYGIFITPICNF